MTPRERVEAFIHANWKTRQDSLDFVFEEDRLGWLLEQMIIADRQALQSEITANLDQYKADSQKRTESQRRVINETIYTVYYLVQSVFAQQSQPIDKSKPHAFQGRSDRWCEICNRSDRAAIHKVLVDVAFQQSVIAEAVLAEREACAKAAISWTADYREVDICHKAADAIRARSNQPEEKPSINIGPTPKEWTVKVDAEEAAKRVETMISSADRIATLHEWQAKDARTVQQLNESNNALSLKVAQLEKEKNELTQKLEKVKEKIEELNPPIRHRYEMCGSERCPACAAGISQ